MSRASTSAARRGRPRPSAPRRAEKISPQARQRKTHSWFTGFAPRRNPEIVVTVLIEYGGLGGVNSAPVARELFELYKAKYAGPNPTYAKLTGS